MLTAWYGVQFWHLLAARAAGPNMLKRQLLVLSADAQRLCDSCHNGPFGTLTFVFPMHVSISDAPVTCEHEH
jgi:hypothetical protein